MSTQQKQYNRLIFNWIASKYDQLDADKAIRSLKLNWAIKHCTLPNGKMWVYEKQRDCDGYESDQIYQIKATRESYEVNRDRILDWAEGPVSFYPITKAEADEFEPSHRDHFAEQMGY